MGKYIAVLLFLAGVGSVLYQWIQQQKVRQQRMEAVVFFLQKTLYTMEREQIRLIPYFLQYESGDEVLQEFLHALAQRLGENRYQYGELAWQELLLEQKAKWKCNNEMFLLLNNAGYGFFGSSRKENVCFLQKSIREMEQQLAQDKEKDRKERKVWLPVGMLGSIMLMILLV